jgi:hypothetical protein
MHHRDEESHSGGWHWTQHHAEQQGAGASFKPIESGAVSKAKLDFR